MPVRALFLSDFHFGYKGVDGAALLACLRHFRPEKIYLAGDIIDGWKMAKRWHWRADYTRVLDMLVAHRNNGAKIIYLPGNHDEAVRHLSPLRRARFFLRTGVRIAGRCVHRMQDGRRIVVLHGDQFDHFLISGAVSRLGDRIYERISEWFGLARPAPQVMVGGVRKPFSLAKALLQRSSKRALRLLSNLERAVERLLAREHLDGLICGHTHVPALHAMGSGRVYGNCGMWMGHTNTAIVETMAGVLEMVRWPDMRDAHAPEDSCITPAQAMAMAAHKETAIVVRKISRLWPDASALPERIRAKTAQRQKRVVDQEGWDLVDIGGLAPLGDEGRAQV